jgi:hypothetical protein
MYATVHPNVPSFFVAQDACRLLDFVAGWHGGHLFIVRDAFSETVAWSISPGFFWHARA